MKNDKNIDRELVSTDARYVSKAIFKKSSILWQVYIIVLMGSKSNGTSYPWKSKVENEIVGLKPIKCVYNYQYTLYQRLFIKWISKYFEEILIHNNFFIYLTTFSLIYLDHVLSTW